MPRVFGLETEYAFVDERSPGAAEYVVPQLLELAADRLAHLPGHHDGGLFLANGSRLYLDVGGHPELATPEVQDPWDAVRYVKAGDRILLDLVEAVRSENPSLKPLILRGNVDYSGSGTTWGCHESYLHSSPLEARELAAQLIPHLVSRIVYAGSGGFDPLSPGIEFTLSPRARHLRRAVSSSSTDNRGIFHTREESLAGPGYRRLHLLCADSLCSETGLWLTVATTAMVVALIEAGRQPGDTVRMRHPVRALRVFAEDPSLTVKVRVGRRNVTAIEVQRHYLAQCERCIGEAFMPAWAGVACELWRRVLDALERDRGQTARILDWQIKLDLYRETLAASELGLDRIHHWNALLAEAAETPAPPPKRPARLPSLTELRRRRTVRREAWNERIGELLARRGIDREAAHPFLKLRARLLEMETRYSALGEAGIFVGLDEAGLLEHRIVEESDVEAARTTPPAVGRARARGEAIRALAGKRGSAHWSQVLDGDGSRLLDLSNPFAYPVDWQPMPRSDERHSLRRRARELNLFEGF